MCFLCRRHTSSPSALSAPRFSQGTPLVAPWAPHSLHWATMVRQAWNACSCPTSCPLLQSIFEDFSKVERPVASTILYDWTDQGNISMLARSATFTTPPNLHFDLLTIAQRTIVGHKQNKTYNCEMDEKRLIDFPYLSLFSRCNKLLVLYLFSLIRL